MPHRKPGTGRRVQRESLPRATHVGRRALRPVFPPRALRDRGARTRRRPENPRDGLRLAGARAPRDLAPQRVLGARQEPPVDIRTAVGLHNSRADRHRRHRDIGDNNEVHKPQVMTVGAIRSFRVFLNES